MLNPKKNASTLAIRQKLKHYFFTLLFGFET